MKKLLSILIPFIGAYTAALSQIQRTNIVEHITNTSCSVCASNNGNIYSAINSNTNVLHISYHPSSPYASDFFNQQNKDENDNRVKYYNQFGATPRVVVNGTPISYSNLSSTLSSLSAGTSNYKVWITHRNFNTDSFEIMYNIKKINSDTMKYMKFFLAAVEDTVSQATNNGESKHYNVFRKALTEISWDSIVLPMTIGDSIYRSIKFKAGSGWNIARIYAIGMIADGNKNILNSARSIVTSVISTPIAPQIIYVQTASSITSTSAVLNASIQANNSETTVTVEYGLTTTYGTVSDASPLKVNGNITTAVSANISGLSPNTLYHFRFKAVNSGGTTYTADSSFKTANISTVAPIISNVSHSNITTASATITANVNGNGSSAAIIVEYGITSSYGSNKAASPSSVSGNTPVSVSAQLTGLTENSTYYFRLKAMNSTDTIYSAQYTFKTSKSSSSIHNNVENEFQLFPNPAKDFITIVSAHEEAIDEVSVSSLNGQVEKLSFMKSSLHNYKADTKSLSKGIYYLRIKSANSAIFEFKLIITE